METPPFVGREPELAAVAADVDAAYRGRGRVVVIEGEAGIGKTRLVDESLDSVAGAVRRAAGDEFGGRRPFGVVVDALGINLREARIGRLLLSSTGAEASAGSGDLEFRVSEALLSHTEDLCADGPLVLVVEDVHWADPSSRVFLARLGRRVGRLPLLIVATRRPVPEVPQLDRLIDGLSDPPARRLRLGPLGEDDVETIARTFLGAQPGRRLLAHLASAAGNPLFVSELLDVVWRSDALVCDAHRVVDLAAGVRPSSLGVLVLHRLSFLPGATLDVLRMAAFLGATCPASDLCRILSVSAVDLAARVRPALMAGVLENDGECFRFRHDVIREALYLDIPEPLRNQLHLDVAEALTVADAAPERIAEHLLRGASRESPDSLPALRAFADRLAVRAPGLAAEILARAAELATGPAERDGLLAERAQALWRAGRLPEAETVCRSLLAGGPEPRARLYLAQVLVSRGRLPEAATVIEEGLRAGPSSGTVEARLLAWAAWVRAHSGHLASAREQAAAAEVAANEDGDCFARIVGIATRAAVTHRAGFFPEAIELIQEALRMGGEPGGEVEHFPLHVLLAAVLFDAGHLEAGQAAVGHALAACEERGFRGDLLMCHWLAARGSFLAGRWDDALAELATAATLAEELGTGSITPDGHVLGAFIALHRGNVPATRRALAAAEEENQRLGSPPMDSVLWGRALLAEASTAPDEALALLWDAWQLCAEAGTASRFPVLGPDLVRLSLEAGDRPRAEAATAAVEEVALRAGTAVMGAAALRCRGLLTDDGVVLSDAAQKYQDCGRPLEAAQASEDAAAALARQGEAEDARALLGRALEHYTLLRATYASARVEARLRDLGVRRGRQGSRRRPRHGWDALTETERTVASLVAEGLSNRQVAERLFLSRHTVHTHVSHILAKLGLASRVELATEALRRSG